MRAFEQLFHLFERPIYNLAWRMLNDTDEARDALQDTMLTVYDKLEQFRGDAPFWGWLRSIAVNINLMRLRRRESFRDFETDMNQIEDANASVSFSEWQHADLERALGVLTERSRSVVWLYFVEGYTHEEIAKTFGQTASFSKSQLARALERMRATLKYETKDLAYA